MGTENKDKDIAQASPAEIAAELERRQSAPEEEAPKEKETTEEEEVTEEEAPKEKEKEEVSTEEEVEEEETPKDGYEKSYKELRSLWNRTQEQNRQYQLKQQDLEKKLNDISTALARSAEDSKIDPKELAKRLETEGIKALDEVLDKRYAPVKQSLEQERDTLQRAYIETNIDMAQLQKASDVENYPLWKQLDPIMTALAALPEYPVDKSLPIDQQLDGLYKLALSTEQGKAIAMKAKQSKTRSSDPSEEERRTVGSLNRNKAPKTKIDMNKISREELAEMIEGNADGGEEDGVTGAGVYDVRF